MQWHTTRRFNRDKALTLIHVEVRSFRRTDVVGRRPNNFVVTQLFKDVSTPADDSAGREHTGEHVAGDAHVVLQTGGLKIDVAVLVDTGFDRLFHRERDVVKLGVAGFNS